MKQTPFKNHAVKVAFEAFDDDKCTLLLELRELIFSVAEESEGVGTIEETLKWGEPAYLTVRPKSGTTIRLGVSKTGKPAVFTHCQTTVVSEFQTLFPDEFTYDGNRAVYVDRLTVADTDKLRLLIKHALTYHQK